MIGNGLDGTQGFLKRRGFVRLVAGSAVALAAQPRSALAFGFGDLFGNTPKPRHVTPYITANKNFYVVAVDPTFRPKFDLKTVQTLWSLEMVGLDGSTQRLDYDSLMHQANRSVLHTFECIGNPVGGTLIGNARWQVIPLRKILQSLPGFGSAHTVMFEALDAFYSSVSIERALDDYAFLAMQMNGVPLPGVHGFPARVLLPDLYGMKQPRWLKRIKLLADKTTTSYWKQLGWSDDVPVKTTSRIDPPGPVHAGAPAVLTGIAYAGRHGVRKVEVSLDDGKHWVPCRILAGPTPDVWSLWRYDWPAPTAGSVQLLVRATDGNGQLQTAERHGTNPSGATGLDQLSLEVDKAQRAG